MTILPFEETIAVSAMLNNVHWAKAIRKIIGTQVWEISSEPSALAILKIIDVQRESLQTLEKACTATIKNARASTE